MSNSNAGLSRDALIEKVAGLIDDQYDDYSPRYNAAGVCVSSGLAAAAVDAVLSAVADDLHGEATKTEMTRIHFNSKRAVDLTTAHANALRYAAERVRDLLGKDKTDE